MTVISTDPRFFKDLRLKVMEDELRWQQLFRLLMQSFLHRLIRDTLISILYSVSCVQVGSSALGPYLSMFAMCSSIISQLFTFSSTESVWISRECMRLLFERARCPSQRGSHPDVFWFRRFPRTPVFNTLPIQKAKVSRHAIPRLVFSYKNAIVYCYRYSRDVETFQGLFTCSSSL